jgi:hypothetical protein
MLASTSSKSRHRSVYRAYSKYPSTVNWLANSVKLALVALLFGGAVVEAGAQEQDPGHFEIRAADVKLEDGVYFLDAWVELRLSADARQALRSGVPLTIRLDVELLRNRRFWMTAGEATLRQRYQLEYHALTERYVVSNLNSGDQVSFSTLFAALNALGRIEKLPLIDAALLDSSRDYDVRVRAVLDTERFPGPLRLLAFWRRDWSLASDWYQWQLQSE